VIATGLEKLTCCQPDADSFENVADATNAPPAVHNAPSPIDRIVPEAAPAANRTPAGLSPSASGRAG